MGVPDFGLWGQVASNIKLQGVIDGDYRPISSTPGVKSLDYHEAESYLCHPDLIVKIAERIGSQELTLTATYVHDFIFTQLSDERTAIAARRAFHSLKINLAASLSRKALDGISSPEDLVDAISQACAIEIAKAQEIFDKQRMISLIDIELNEIDNIIKSKDLDKALRYIPGKELLQKLSPKAGFRNGTDLMRSLSKNFDANSFPHTEKLKSTLKNI